MIDKSHRYKSLIYLKLKEIYTNIQIFLYDRIVTVFLLITNQMEFRSVHNLKEKCHYDNIFPVSNSKLYEIYTNIQEFMYDHYDNIFPYCDPNGIPLGS